MPWLLSVLNTACDFEKLYCEGYRKFIIVGCFCVSAVGLLVSTGDSSAFSLHLPVDYPFELRNRFCRGVSKFSRLVNDSFSLWEGYPSLCFFAEEKG